MIGACMNAITDASHPTPHQSKIIDFCQLHLRAKSRLRRLRSETRLRAQPAEMIEIGRQRRHIHSAFCALHGWHRQRSDKRKIEECSQKEKRCRFSTALGLFFGMVRGRQLAAASSAAVAAGALLGVGLFRTAGISLGGLGGGLVSQAADSHSVVRLVAEANTD